MADNRTSRLEGASVRYQRLATLIASDFRYARALAEVVGVSEQDYLAKALVDVAESGGTSLLTIRAIVDAEFESRASLPGTLLRQNSIASKVMGYFVRRHAEAYLRDILAEPLKSLLHDTSKDFEVNPRRFMTLPEEKQQEVLQTNAAALREFSTLLLERLISPQFAESLPWQVKVIASFIRAAADRHDLSDKASRFIGGFIMLRFFNPAVVSPEAFNVLEEVPQTKGRRNLILTAKLLQNLSNDTEFGKKEPFMIPFNDFVLDNKERMKEYLFGLAELDEANTRRVRELQDSAQEVDVAKINIKNLILIHGYLDAHGVAVMKIVQDAAFGGENASADVIDKDAEFVQLIKDMGPPPTPRGRKPAGDDAEVTEAKVDTLLEGSIENYIRHGDRFDTSAMQRAKFFYEGPSDKFGRPVFYLIASRVSPEFMKQMALFVVHIIKVFGNKVNSPFTLVIDMSWSRVLSRQRANVYHNISGVAKMFSRNHKKNLKDVFVVHPSAFTKTVLWLMRGFTSKKMKRKIHEVYNWRQLMEFIPEDHIRLPEESKHFIAKSYRLKKVNSKGRTQTRLLKLTLHSILNIDPGSHTIQNEKYYKQIEGWEPVSERPEIHLRFKDEEAKIDVGFFRSDKSTQADKVSRRYLCEDFEQQKEILRELSELFVIAESTRTRQAFNIVFTATNGKTDRRIIKFTKDSLLVIQKNKIKEETHYTGISSVAVDEGNPRELVVYYKNGNTQRFMMPDDDAASAVESMNGAMDGFGKSIEEFKAELRHRSAVYSGAADAGEGDEQELEAP